jgi:anti-anti-sigma regulatory factor
LRLANPSERMAEVLNLAGLDTVFSIYDEATAAVGSF